MKNTVYLKKLLDLRDNFTIKLITGFRGTGKTTLLNMFADYLRNNDVDADEIIYLNFEELDYIPNFQQLYEVVAERIANLDRAYLLFDEIQLVSEWEKAVNALFLSSSVEIYVTGANETALIADIAKLLPDNFDVLRLYPFSFTEYAEFASGNMKNINILTFSEQEILRDYLNFGGLPIISNTPANEEILKQILIGAYYEALFKDILAKNSVRDANLFNAITNFLALNIGTPVRPNTIDAYLAEMNLKTTTFTLDNYLNLLDEAGILRKVRRYDLRKDSVLNGADHFYCVDTGICNAIVNFKKLDATAVIKNAVCIELWRKGYEVYCARLGAMMIDFFAVSGKNKLYIQVLPVDGKTSVGRTLRPLNKLDDSSDRILISLEPIKVRNNIKNFTAAKFLSGNWLS